MSKPWNTDAKFVWNKCVGKGGLRNTEKPFYVFREGDKQSNSDAVYYYRYARELTLEEHALLVNGDLE